MRLRRFASFLLPRFSAYGDDQGYGRPMIPMGCVGRLLIAGVIAAVALFQYFNSHPEVNSFTGRTQHLGDIDQRGVQQRCDDVRDRLAGWGDGDVCAADYHAGSDFGDFGVDDPCSAAKCSCADGPETVVRGAAVADSGAAETVAVAAAAGCDGGLGDDLAGRRDGSYGMRRRVLRSGSADVHADDYRHQRSDNTQHNNDATGAIGETCAIFRN